MARDYIIRIASNTSFRYTDKPWIFTEWFRCRYLENTTRYRRASGQSTRLEEDKNYDNTDAPMGTAAGEDEVEIKWRDRERFLESDRLASVLRSYNATTLNTRSLRQKA
ncbi:hypothetical protein ABW19_dt0204357 [Dactylella cylindrospora]|nr:hypothetical protein ABW19_dt0204357 [Dactylella cylindrospora]